MVSASLPWTINTAIYSKGWTIDTTSSPPTRRRKPTPRTVQSVSRKLLSDARYRARQRGLDFDLTLEWVEARVAAGRCEATGLPLDIHTPGSPWSASIDRLRNQLGYQQANCRLTSILFNKAKGPYHANDLLLMSMAIVKQHDEGK